MKKKLVLLILSICTNGLIAAMKTILILILWTSILFAQDISFHRITSENGLPGDYVQAIIQDHYGFIWIGTGNGLCRYDGKQVITYQHHDTDLASIASNNVTCVIEDASHHIWAGGYNGGLNFYNRGTNSFSNFLPIESDTTLLSKYGILDIGLLKDSKQIVTTGSAQIFNPSNGRFTKIALPENTWWKPTNEAGRKYFSSNNSTVTTKGTVWFWGVAGFVIYDPVQGRFTTPTDLKNVPQEMLNVTTTNGAEDALGNMWIGSDAGLHEYVVSENKFIRHFPSAIFEDQINSSVRCVLSAKDSSIWFGTNNGLIHYFPQKQKFTLYRNDPSNSASISDNNIVCIYQDKQEIIWVGTGNGLNTIYPFSSSFRVYRNSPGDVHSLSTSRAYGSFKDNSGNLWIGTDNGLEEVNIATGKVSIYSYRDKKLTTEFKYCVNPVYPYDSNTLWLGTWGAGLQLFDISKRKFVASFVHLNGDTTTISSNFIRRICKDHDGNFWMATWNGGVEEFIVREHRFKHFRTGNSGLYSDFVSIIHCDQDGDILVGNGGGIQILDHESNRFRSFSVSNKSPEDETTCVSSVCDDTNGKLWVGTLGSLVLFDKKNGTFKKIERFNYPVYGVLRDKGNWLWLGTNRGLQHYNPVTDELFTYTLKDGLPSLVFYDSFICQSKDGEVLMNTMAGLISFHPEKMHSNMRPPALHFTSVKIQNREWQEAGDFTALSALELSYNQNYLTVAFAALNLIHPELNQYRYKLEGMDDEWISSGTRNEVTYTQLRPGSYVLHVQGSNEDGIWNEEGISLSIHVATPWFQSWWFFLLCAFAGFSLIYSIYYFSLKKKLEKQEALATERLRISRELHDDIGSTLGSIAVYSDVAKSLSIKNENPFELLSKIGRASRELMDKMSDIIWSLNPDNESFEQLLNRMQAFASMILAPRNISVDYKFDDDLDLMKLTGDQRKNIFLIYKEAIHNIVKYAECKSVFISLVKSNNNLVMLIKDDGKGFETNLAGNSNSKLNGMGGNGIKNMMTRAKDIQADFNIISKANEGTVVELTLKV